MSTPRRVRLLHRLIRRACWCSRLRYLDHVTPTLHVRNDLPPDVGLSLTDPRRVTPGCLR